ncbi:MAG: GNAT family N-acetyltransferase, partial [Kangiellaceae bacterium]|nr:GNAT family N-acetyltransferase [Kangiellaceae bacterium]
VEYERPFEERMKKEHFHYYDLAELIELSTAQVLVAESNGQLVGSGFVHIRKGRDYLNYESHGYLGFMYVDPNFRGQGLNKRILQELTSWAKDKDLNVLCLTVFAENKSAIRAYQKAGFHANLIEMRLNLND